MFGKMSSNFITKSENYLKQFIKKHSSKIKIVTGLRKSGKSYLLGVIFKQHLIEKGVKEEQIIYVELEDEKNDSLLEKGKHII